MSLSFLNPTALVALLLVPVLLAVPLVGRARGGQSRQFWTGLGLRALILTAVILGLAGAQLVLPVNHTTVVFVVDHSDSVTPADQQRAETFVREALGTMRTGDRAAVVVFGENALVERLASEDNALASITSIPRSERTNLAAALRLALALLTDDANRRVVILSDGLENAGRAEELKELAAARQVELDFVGLTPPQGANEVVLDGLDAPSGVRQGQQFEVVAHISSTASGAATVRLFGDGNLLATQAVTLQAGTTRVAFALEAEDAGFKRYTAELDATNDTLKQNNTGAAFTLVQGPPRVLVVENTAGEADNLIEALESAGVAAERVAPAAMPGETAQLANYDAVFLVNVPADALPDRAMQNLPSYVRDLGRGLVMIGGQEAYGAGGYLRTPIEKALPVDMDVPARQQQPNLALAFVIDKSGSMGQCHCDDPNAQPGSYPQVASGLAKVELAKDAVMQASRALGRADYAGVVLFDANAHWAMRVQQFTNEADVQERIGGAQANGGTNIFAGMSEAVGALESVSAKFKHLILLTDGWSNSGNYDALIEEMQKQGITLSIVAAGNGSAPQLEELARRGGGRYFAARSMTEVPELFFQETVRATGQYIIEEPFQPIPAGTTPILRGLDVTRLPALRGYNGTTPKATARVALVSGRGDPVLATWQYGLGRSAVWTSDLKGQWATDWLAWGGFNTFVAQLTNWVLPQPNDTGLQAMFVNDGEQTTVQVVSTDANGRPREATETQAQIIAPDGTTQTIPLNPSAPGTYSAPLNANASGIYLAQITQREANGEPIASTTSGLVVPYSPEYRMLASAVREPSAGVLGALAAATNGEELTEPAQAFEPFALPAARTQPIWEYLLIAAALLFPLDVAMRRLRFGESDWERLRAGVRGALRMPDGTMPQTEPAAPRALEGLFAARERAQPRVTAAKPTKTAERVPTVVENEEAQENPALAKNAPPVAARTEENVDDGDMTARLKKARERAQKSRR